MTRTPSLLRTLPGRNRMAQMPLATPVAFIGLQQSDLSPAILVRGEATFARAHQEYLCGSRRDGRSPPHQPGAERTWRKRRTRSEEHQSELQSLMRIPYAVFCLKKKNNIIT